MVRLVRIRRLCAAALGPRPPESPSIRLPASFIPCSTRYDLTKATRIEVDEERHAVRAIDGEPDAQRIRKSTSESLVDRGLLLGRTVFGDHGIRLLPTGVYGTILEKMRTLAASWRGRLYFAYLPSHLSVLNATCDPNRAAVERIVTSHGIPFIDVGVALRATRAPASLYRVHLTPEGYHVAARYVLEQLVELDRRSSASPATP
jgi:hypothetical protein